MHNYKKALAWFDENVSSHAEYCDAIKGPKHEEYLIESDCEQACSQATSAIRNALMLADKVTQKADHEFVRKAFGSHLHGLMCNVLAGEFETMIQQAQEEIQ